MRPNTESLTEKERQWVEVQLHAAEDFVKDMLSKPVQMTLRNLDRAFEAWVDSVSKKDVSEINRVINCVGVAFGQILVDQIGLTWVIATDKDGSDLAVYGLPDRGDVLIFPANFVAKRWERDEVNFLEESFHEIAKQVKDLQEKSIQ
jgi:uncharacterized protein DUF3806